MFGGPWRCETECGGVRLYLNLLATLCTNFRLACSTICCALCHSSSACHHITVLCVVTPFPERACQGSDGKRMDPHTRLAFSAFFALALLPTPSPSTSSIVLYSLPVQDMFYSFLQTHLPADLNICRLVDHRSAIPSSSLFEMCGFRLVGKGRATAVLPWAKAELTRFLVLCFSVYCVKDVRGVFLEGKHLRHYFRAALRYERM